MGDDLTARAKNAGIDLQFAKKVEQLKKLKILVDQGAVKPEIYKKLEDEVFKKKETVSSNDIPKKGQDKKRNFARTLFKKKNKAEGGISQSSTRSRGGSIKSSSHRNRSNSTKSIVSVVSGRANSMFGRKQPSSILLEAPMMLFVTVRRKKAWKKVHATLFTDKIVFKKEKEGKMIKTYKLNEDYFVSTVDEKGANKVVQRAIDDTASLDSENEENMKTINETVEKMDEIQVMSNVFVIASLTAKKNSKILLACEDEQQRELWVAMTCEVLRDIREFGGGGKTKGWINIDAKAQEFAHSRLGKELDKPLADIDAENLERKVSKWKKQGTKVAGDQFLQEWRSREAQRMRKENKELKKELEKKNDEFVEFKEETQKKIQEVTEKSKKEVAEEKKKNQQLNQKYDELMEKYRAEAYNRNLEKKKDEKRIKKRINALQRRSVMPSTAEAQHYKDQLEEFKKKLATLQKAMNIDLDEMDWDGTLEQAEERMQECLKGILEGETTIIQAKAQQDFDKWDQLVRGHADYIAREENKWTDWESENFEKNRDALNEMREKFVPEEFKVGCSIKTLMELKGLKKKTAERIFKNKIFKFLWMDKGHIAKIHGAALTNDYASQGLDIRELRAVYAALPTDFESDTDGKKKQFREIMRAKLFTLTEKEKNGRILPGEILHNDYRDKPVANHVRPKFEKVKRKPKMNNKLKGNAAALEAFFNKGNSGPPMKKTKSKAIITGRAPAEALDPADPQWKKYFFMQKQNLPDGAIEQKMLGDGKDPKSWKKLKELKANGGASNKKPKESELNPNSKEFKVYFTMKANGLETGAIKNKMVRDGKDPELWDKLVALKKEKKAAKAAKIVPKVKENKPLNVDDPCWAEYFKMRKLKLSEGQIMNKMQQDGKDPTLWAKLVALKEKDVVKTAKHGNALDPFNLLTEDLPVLSTVKDDDSKDNSIDISEGPEDVEDALKRARLKKRKSKAGKKITLNENGEQIIKRKKKKKKSKSIAGEKRKSGRSSLRNNSKTKVNLLQKDAKDLVSLAALNIDVDIKRRKSGRGLNIMDYGENTNRGKRGSVREGRKKTLRKSKVATGGLKDDSQLQQVLDYILTDGADDAKGRRTMKFGEVHDNFLEISDILVGLLLKGKKTGLLKYKGDMLFKGIHDQVIITVA